MQADAPGKLIVSGEHAVLYGCPAVVTAVDRRVRTTVTPMDAPGLRYRLRGATAPETLTSAAACRLLDGIAARWHRFAAGTIPITAVLERKTDLIPAAAALALGRDRLDHHSGLDLEVSAAVPLGCGMGASAAVAVSVLRAVTAARDVPITNDALYDLAFICESWIHGTPSGVDPCIAVHGGWLRFCEGEAEPIAARSLPLTAIHTGVPATTTGECVAHVAAANISDAIWDRFARVAADVATALATPGHPGLIEAVRENHRLLCRIGVVPEPVQQLVAAIEHRGGAAKVCGAGAVRGEAGGMVLVFADSADYTDLVKAGGYTVLKLEGGAPGVQLG